MIYEFFRLFYPKNCLLCGTTLVKSEQHVCMLCFQQLPFTQTHISPNNNELVQLFWGKTDISYGLSYLYYQKRLQVQKIIHFLKYKNKPEIGVWLGMQYGRILKKYNIFGPDCILIPVPLHEKKLLQRGYNQAECFANGLATYLEAKVNINILYKKTHTETQTKKDKIERWTNVNEVFYAHRVPEIQNKHVVLVDDVITTGATLEACINAVRSANDVSVSICTICLAAE